MEMGMKLLSNIFKMTGTTNSIMKFAVVILVVTAMSTPANGQVKYTIKALRTLQEALILSEIANFPLNIEPEQNITYYQDFNEENPLKIDAVLEITDTSTVIYAGAEPIDACGNGLGNWESTILAIVGEAFAPDGTCPIEKGEYIVYEHVPPINTAFDDKIDCGDYYLYVELYRETSYFLTAGLNFTIDDNCNS